MAEELEIQDQAPAFEIGLCEGGDEGSDFRTQNDPSAPLQRRNIVERRGVVDIRCNSVDVIHGYLKDGEDPATLIVYEFQFDPRKKARRISIVDIEFSFGSDGGKEPEVLKISNKGRMVLGRTSLTETITQGGEAKAGGNILGAEIGGSWKWEKASTRETNDATTIVGSIDLPHGGRNYGAPNTATWTIIENQTMKTGVPAYIRTAVLLSRNDDEDEFFSTFKIKAKADLRSGFAQLFGRTPKDDPILYDATLPPTNKLQQYDTNSLGQVDLQDFAKASFTNYEE
ncbi:hypothetical protein F5B22DRAFT_636200 [Xylaria bambusicola]|uniref:uncharacterized protein n=1 Tax=Xylaria bambusicola TaxID=326684 RepID=UPI002008A637|nr:uncharacterized protein F5B22DRAFT_636200 [Xylaria bambusicola]KAI0516991.1 hypothetical protein F5B22DRAFT_636200 [Xylaria bambusicola]